MAKFSCDIDEELYEKLRRADNVDELAPKMLENAIGIVVNRMASYLSQFNDTGAMVKSIKPTKAKKNQWGWYISARPTGSIKRKNKEIKNMDKLIYLVRGHIQKSKFGKKYGFVAPKADLSVVSNSAIEEVENMMQETLNKEIGI